MQIEISFMGMLRKTNMKSPEPPDLEATVSHQLA